MQTVGYYYTDKSQTPLKWHTWMKISTILGAIRSIIVIFNVVKDYRILQGVDGLPSLFLKDILPLYIIEIVFHIVWIGLCITVFIGLRKFKPYGLYLLIAMSVFRIIIYVVLGILWTLFAENGLNSLSPTQIEVLEPLVSAISTKAFSQARSMAIVSVVFGVLIYIYYDKRKPLFFPEMAQYLSEYDDYDEDDEYDEEDDTDEDDYDEYDENDETEEDDECTKIKY